MKKAFIGIALATIVTTINADERLASFIWGWPIVHRTSRSCCGTVTTLKEYLDSDHELTEKAMQLDDLRAFILDQILDDFTEDESPANQKKQINQPEDFIIEEFSSLQYWKMRATKTSTFQPHPHSKGDFEQFVGWIEIEKQNSETELYRLIKNCIKLNVKTFRTATTESSPISK